MKYTFTLPGVTPSQNKLDGHHWRKKHAYRDYWHQVVGYTAKPCLVTPKKAHVKVVRVSNRLIDPLNVYAGLKWLLDAFVLLGWLTGDGYKDLTIEADQRKCQAEEPHMEVTITYG